MRSRPVTLASRARRYVTGAALVSLAVAFVVFFAAWTMFTIEVRTNELARQTVALARGLEAAGVSEPGVGWIPTGVRERLFRVQAGLIGATLFVTDAEGIVLLSSAEELDVTGRAIPLEGLSESDERGLLRGMRTTLDGTRIAIVAVPFDGGERWLVATQTLEEIVTAQRWTLLLLAVGMAFATLAAYVTGGLFAGRLTSPLVRVTEAAEAVAAGEWGRQVEEADDDPAEVRSLSRSFNRMSSGVASAYAAQKEFVGDVSHELRTPITSIQGWTEALLDGTADDAEKRERALQALHDEAMRVQDLTSTLLALSDLDAGTVRFAREPVDPEKLLEGLTSRHGPVAESVGTTLRTEDVSGGAAPLADGERMLQAASILVSNALAYTPAGGAVLVRAESVPATAGKPRAFRVVVEDSGPGIPEDMREAVFERFRRLERSRSSRHGGSGLGLAICRKLVEGMGGTVTAGHSAALGGARFAIELPVAPFTEDA